MSEDREFEGRDLDSAIQTAAESLGVPPADLHYRIVEGGRRGLFGLGAKRVRIQVEEAPGPEPSRGGREEVDRAATEREARDLEETLLRMLRLIGADLTARIETMAGGVRVELTGPDRRLLVQKDGELIAALQFLLNRMARRAWPGLGHVVIECDGHRISREEDLVELAREVARQVARTGRPKRLHSMNPYERRLVHLTVKEFPGLTTSSEGNGFLKRVTVAPTEVGGRV